MQGALSMDWAPMETTHANVASYAEAAAPLGRGEFASRFTPPPAGGAVSATGGGRNGGRYEGKKDIR